MRWQAARFSRLELRRRRCTALERFHKHFVWRWPVIIEAATHDSIVVPRCYVWGEYVARRFVSGRDPSTKRGVEYRTYVDEPTLQEAMRK